MALWGIRKKRMHLSATTVNYCTSVKFLSSLTNQNRNVYLLAAKFAREDVTRHVRHSQKEPRQNIPISVESEAKNDKRIVFRNDADSFFEATLLKSRQQRHLYGKPMNTYSLYCFISAYIPVQFYQRLQNKIYCAGTGSRSTVQMHLLRTHVYTVVHFPFLV